MKEVLVNRGQERKVQEHRSDSTREYKRVDRAVLQVSVNELLSVPPERNQESEKPDRTPQHYTLTPTSGISTFTKFSLQKHEITVDFKKISRSQKFYLLFAGNTEFLHQSPEQSFIFRYGLSQYSSYIRDFRIIDNNICGTGQRLQIIEGFKFLSDK